MSLILVPYISGHAPADLRLRWSTTDGNSVIIATVANEPFNEANLATYEIAAAREQGTTGVFEFEIPAQLFAAGPHTYSFVVRDSVDNVTVAVGETTPKSGTAGLLTPSVIEGEIIACTAAVSTKSSQASVDAIALDLDDVASQASVDAIAGALVTMETTVQNTYEAVVRMETDGVTIQDMFGVPFDVITERMHAAACGDRDVSPDGSVEQYIGSDGIAVVFQSTINQTTGNRVVQFN